MKNERTDSTDYRLYVCPGCKGALGTEDGGLRCQTCGIFYPIVEGIPDFITIDLESTDDELLKWANTNYDRLAPVYEWSRYPWRLLLHAGIGAPSLQDLVRLTGEMVSIRSGVILDVACGPGTFGRRIASPETTVYGIDISMGMLRKGSTYMQAEGKQNMHFARGLVETLPFMDESFDAAVCTAALHLFSDPLAALCEITRTLKPGAPLAVQTMSADHRGIFRFRRVRKEAHKRGSHLFTIPQLQEYARTAGLEKFHSRQFGSMILFKAEKDGSNR